MDTPVMVDGSVVAAIGWFYLVTNSARVITYIPQIVAVWRCRDGARSLSLITWCSWVVSHAAAIAYGLLVIHDGYFVVISLINFTCCTAVAGIAALRRGLFAALPWPQRGKERDAVRIGTATGSRERLDT